MPLRTPRWSGARAGSTANWPAVSRRARELDFSSPLELLVATILSAQTTDKRVNMAIPTRSRGPDRRRLCRCRPRGTREDHRVDRLLPRQDQQPDRMGRRCDRFGARCRRGCAIWSPCPAWPQDRERGARDAFGIPGITVDTTSAGWPGASVGPRAWSWSKVEAEVATPFRARNGRSSRTGCLARTAGWPCRKPACGACALATLCPSFGEGPTDPELAAQLVKSGPFS